MKTRITNVIPENINTLLSAHGWKQIKVGGSFRIDYDCRYQLFIRRRNLQNLTHEKQEKTNRNGDVSKMSPANTPETTGNTDISSMESKNPMGSPSDQLTPSPDKSLLPMLSDFEKYPSLRALRTTEESLVIAMDSEWYYPNNTETGDRMMLSWQFSVIDKEDLVEFVFLRSNRFDLTLEIAVGCILDKLGVESIDTRKITRYKSQSVDPDNNQVKESCYNTRREAENNAAVVYDDGKKVHAFLDWQATKHFSVTLLCHAGKADISSLDQSGKMCKKILAKCTEVNGGLVTLKPTHFHPASLKPEYNNSGHTHRYPVSLSVADTLCHTPAKMQSLKALGNIIRWHKVELEDDMISKMDELLLNDPCSYFEYASNDSIVTLLYGSTLYGYNKLYPVTITSATAKVMRSIMASQLGCDSISDFERKYRGLQTVSHGLMPATNRPGYIESTSKEPISDKANSLQYYASQAYHGGYNSCSDVGYFSQKTYDYDLRNAYPTAMCLVPDVNWEKPFLREINNRELTLQDFLLPTGGYAPLLMMVAYVTFEFPDSVKYPCIPVSVNGVPVYCRTSDGLDGVYACGPELYLALQLGAKIWVERGFIIRNLSEQKSGNISCCLGAAVKQFVVDREQAKIDHGKKSPEEMILKTMVNSGYGKNAQNVVQKDTWSARNDAMEDLGCSAITNPVSACMTTSIVRAELLAAQNQCTDLGYTVCSVTTDGFISDIPEDTLKSLDLYGIREYMEKARLFLTDNKDPEIWEIKHSQNDLVNYTTRGNVSLSEHGVCAHNGTKSGYKPDSPEDRLWLMESVLSRSKAVDYTTSEWTHFKELVKGTPFSVSNITRHVRMDFDMKRKPVRSSFEAQFPEINGEIYEIACFTTKSFENVSEFLLYREKKNSTTVLRTMEDWDKFWCKVDTAGKHVRVRDLEWAILNSCIIGYRAGFWAIPALDNLTGQERNDWINAHNASKHTFKTSDWKNAGRSTRQSNMLPREMLTQKINELQQLS